MEWNSTQSDYKLNIYNLLQTIGIADEAVEDTFEVYGRELSLIFRMTKELSCHSRTIVSTLTLFELIISKTNRPHYSTYHNRREIQKRFRCLRFSDENWRDVERCYSFTMHNIVGTPLSDDPIGMERDMSPCLSQSCDLCAFANSELL